MRSDTDTTVEAAAAEAEWVHLSRVPDEVVLNLPRGDREAVPLRFYQRKRMSEVGAGLGVSEDAAKKRVAKTVERLRERLGRKNVAPPLAPLSAARMTNVTSAAPISLPSSAVAIALSAPGAVAVGGSLMIANGAMTTMFLAKAQAMAAVALIVAVPLGIGCGVYAPRTGRTGGPTDAAGPTSTVLAQGVEQVVPETAGAPTPTTVAWLVPDLRLRLARQPRAMPGVRGGSR